VRLGVHHQSSDSSCQNKSSSSHKHQSQSPSWQQWLNIQNSLLSSVGEVVVSGVHVVESSSGVHHDESSIKVLRSRVELHAVLDVLLDISCIVVVLGQEGSHGETVSLSNHCKVISELGSVKEGSVLRDPHLSGWCG